MFPRVVEVKYKDKVYQYLRLVESYRDSRGRVRQRTVWKVGRLDKLLEEGKLEKIVEALSKFCLRPKTGRATRSCSVGKNQPPAPGSTRKNAPSAARKPAM